MTDAAADTWEFWSGWCHSVRPSQTLCALRESGALPRFPELEALVGVPQDPEWHPEGDVWVHTLLVCDAAAAIANRHWELKFGLRQGPQPVRQQFALPRQAF